MMDAYRVITCCRLLFLLLCLHVCVSLAKPRTKAEVGGGGTQVQSETSAMMVANSRRSLLRKRMSSPMSPQTIKNLAEYKKEIARKMANVRTPEEFLRVFFPVDSVKSRWTKMVNESVQNAWRTGRTQDVQADRPTFTSETAQQEMAKVSRHGMSVHCREPLPVLIDMYQELNLTRGGLVYVYPECTKVRRCEGSGCCQNGAPCVGKESTRQNITKSFITLTVRPDSTKHKDASYIKHSFHADTECVCKERPQAPVCQPTICSQTMTFDEVTCRCQCSKPCPRPYIQNPDTCDCSCNQKDSGCKKIKRSRRRMAATECTCVMENRCLQPACNKGYTFSTTSCRCSANGSRQRNPNRKRDRAPDRDGRTDQAQLNLPYPPPHYPRGRTNIGPELLPFPLSSSEEEEEEPDVTGAGGIFQDESSSSDSDDQDAAASQGGLFASWDFEECGSSCRSQTGHPGNDDGSGDEGDVLDL